MVSEDVLIKDMALMNALIKRASILTFIAIIVSAVETAALLYTMLGNQRIEAELASIKTVQNSNTSKTAAFSEVLGAILTNQQEHDGKVVHPDHLCKHHGFECAEATGD